jgi:transglutaminase-like putative cysteine protease
MRLAIQHTTRYLFAETVAHGMQRLRLTPKATQGQKVIDWTMTYEGADEQLAYDDQNCNHVTLVSVREGAREVAITCAGTVDTEDHAGVIGRHSGHLPLWSFLSHTPLTRPGPRLRQLVAAVDRSHGALETLHDLSRVVRAAVGYEPGASSVHTTAEETVADGRGVCQDHTHVFIAAARTLDLPARYVSGYLMMDDRVQQDATHAWAEAFVEGLGWVGFDVANEICPDHRYVRVATGRDYAEAAPVTGITSGVTVADMHVALAVEQQVAAQ